MVRALALIAAALAVAGCGGGDDGDSARPAPRVVWAVGDAATAQPEAPRAVARMIARNRVDRLLYVGDVYETGTLEEFRRFYDPLYGDLASRSSPIVGNHEAANRKRGYNRYWREKVGRAPEPWYVVREGGWELIGLDSELPHDEDSPQVAWLRRQVRPGTTCRIAFLHRPLYSAGTHGDQSDIAPLWDTLRGRAVAVIAGHDHNLQRLKPIGGLVQFVSGSGGRDLYPVNREDERVAFADDTHFGALRLELRPGSAEWAFVAADGSVLDEGTLRCER